MNFWRMATAILAGLWWRSQKEIHVPQKPRDLGILESQRRNPMVFHLQAEVETQKTRLGMETSIETR